MTSIPDNEFGFTFGGIHSREFNIRVIDIKRNILPLLTENVQTVPGKRGNIYQGTSLQSKSFDVDIVIVAGSQPERADLAHQISQWLMPLSIGEFELIFDDEQDYSYFAHVTVASQIENQLCHGETTITFTCSDPLAYGVQQSLDMVQEPFTITPDGLSDCFPIFTCIPKKDVTKIAIADQQGNYAYIGNDVDEDTQDSPVDNEPRVVHDECNSFGTGWSNLTTTPTFEIENGVISSDASLRSTEDYFEIGKDSGGYADFGSHVSGKWHGAGVQYYFPQAYSDYRIRTRMFNTQHYNRARGKIELYLLDANGKRIGRMYLKDNGTGQDVWAIAEIGTHNDAHELYYGQGNVRDKRNKKIKVKLNTGTQSYEVAKKNKTKMKWKTYKLTESLEEDTFTDFYGYIQIQKIGNTFSCEIMKFDQDSNPAWPTPITRTYTDKDGHFAKAVAGVALYIAKFDIYEDTQNAHYENNHMALCDLKVWNIINGGNTATEVSPVARAGDEVKIDTENNMIYKNGAIYMNRLNIGSNMPKMHGGVPNTYAFDPDPDDADWSVDYRPTKP